MKPTKNTKFLPISELEKYSNPDKYFCDAVVYLIEQGFKMKL